MQNYSSVTSAPTKWSVWFDRTYLLVFEEATYIPRRKSSGRLTNSKKSTSMTKFSTFLVRDIVVALLWPETASLNMQISHAVIILMRFFVAGNQWTNTSTSHSQQHVFDKNRLCSDTAQMRLLSKWCHTVQHKQMLCAKAIEPYLNWSGTLGSLQSSCLLLFSGIRQKRHMCATLVFMLSLCGGARVNRWPKKLHCLEQAARTI